MKIKIYPTFLVVLFLTIFFIFYRGLQNTNIYIPSDSVKKNIPSIEAKIFDTNNRTNYKEIFKSNKFYIMNIWASWCSPCREEHAFLIELSKQKNIEIIGLNYKDKNESAKLFLEEFDNPYKIIISDEDGTAAIEWGAYGVPETFLIYNKKIIKKVIGPLNKSLVLEIKNLIK